eukprot:Em0006g1366a
MTLDRRVIDFALEQWLDTTSPRFDLPSAKENRSATEKMQRITRQKNLSNSYPHLIDTSIMEFESSLDQNTMQELWTTIYNRRLFGFRAITGLLMEIQLASPLKLHSGAAEAKHHRPTKTKYKWQVFPEIGLPSAIDVSSLNLPSDEQFGTVKGIDFTKDIIAGAVTLEFTAVFTKIDSLSQYEQLAKAMGKPEFPTYELSRWMRDEEFCSMVKSSMDSGLSLEDEMKLKQEPGSDNPIFLPTDSWADWTLAKMYYQCAHAQFHQIATHYLSCHAVMETYGMGIMRNLPDAHPVYRLLRPHFRYTMAINARARETLINDGGIIDIVFAIGGEGRRELMRRGGAAYNIHWTNIKRNVKSRGVDDPNLLPGYYYRDDGLKLWQAMEDFVAKIINEFYSSDEDVQGDSELQNVASDLYTNGFPANALLHQLGQYDMYSYTPNAATSMRLPPPTTKGVANNDTLIRSLPDKYTGSLVIAMGFILSQHSKDERYLGTFPTERFTEDKAQVEIENFRKTLTNLDADIVERNKPLDVPYVYMRPSRVTNSITI